MIRYTPGELEKVLNHKENVLLVEEIDSRFFSSCVKEPDYDRELQKALDRLSDAGEHEFIENLEHYLYNDG